MNNGGNAKDAFCGAKAQNTIAASKENHDVIEDEDHDVTAERRRVDAIDPYSTKDDVRSLQYKPFQETTFISNELYCVTLRLINEYNVYPGTSSSGERITQRVYKEVRKDV